MTVPQWRRGECVVARQVVQLPPRAAELLAVFLLQPPDRPLPVGFLIGAMWEPDTEPASAEQIVRHQIAVLRRARVMIEGRYGTGYHLPARRRAPDRPHCRQPGRCAAKTELHCCACANVARGRSNGLRPTQAAVLDLVLAREPMTQPEMAEALGIGRGDVQRILGSLERKRLIVTRHSRHRSARATERAGPALATAARRRIIAASPGEELQCAQSS